MFPLSNWAELDVWSYIRQEHIPVVPLYFARLREVVNRGGMLVPVYHNMPPAEGEKVERVIRLHVLHRCRAVGSDHDRRNHRRAETLALLRTPEPRHGSRPGRIHGVEEAGWYF